MSNPSSPEINNVVVVVEWIDASYQRGELTVPEMTPLMRLRTAGWLVREDKESISIALDRCDSEHSYRDVTHIPKSGVVSIQRIKVKK